ncbi:putative metal homeostasis protein [Companilactobacillus nantensis]|nr:putative metal homeostasis protein [Companilactobacillus nantensis]
MEKMTTATAYRRLKSPNIKTRKRALRAIKDSKRKLNK